jgi:predicted nucleic acid-binding protein
MSSTPGGFLDSNVLLYAFTADARAAVAQALLERGSVTSVQGLNEFTNVTRRKLGMSWEEVRAALADIRTLSKRSSP